MWAGIEPEEGKINRSYVDVLKSIVEQYAEYGIYVILDMHQDVLWQAGEYEDQGYWGVPKWIKDKLEKPKNTYPWPFLNITSWACGYFTEEVSQGFGQFYSNVNGVADSFAKFWGFMAQEFKEYDTVLGYELINEPFVGDIYQAFSLMLPGLAGSLNLAPLYEKAAAEIRKVDSETIIFYEPVIWSYFPPVDENPVLDSLLTNLLNTMDIFNFRMFFEAICGPMVDETIKIDGKMIDSKVDILGPGFTHVPGGSNYENRSVLSWHYYCATFTGNATLDTILGQFMCDVVTAPQFFNTVQSRIEEIGGGSMLTEFGLCTPNATNPGDGNTIECNAVMHLADRYFQSWTYWDTSDEDKFWDANNQLINETVSVFSRPFPLSTNGMPKSLDFDPKRKTFEFTFELNCMNSYMATEIYVPYLTFRSHFEIDMSDGLHWKWSESKSHIIEVSQNDYSLCNKLVFIKINARENY